MLRQRLLTAIVLIPLVVAVVLLSDNAVLAVVLGAATLVGAWELARLANLAGNPARLAFVGFVGVLMAAAWYVSAVAIIEPLLWLLAGWWVVVTVLVLTRRRALEPVSGPRFAVLAAGGAILVGAWLSLVVLHGIDPNGPTLVLFLLVLIWVADSGAYFAGKAFGRRKLAPHVSPGKTWAGVVGALLGAALSALLLRLSGLVGEPALVPLVLLCVFVTVVSIGGDLWESRLKREAGMKDSGALLPGHGGMLDRIDSLIAAAPVFALGAALLGVNA
jgi:phosphatidate cytidylyltransferase